MSVSDFKETYPSDKPLSIWAKYVTVPLSFVVSPLLHRVKFSANQVTYLSIFISFIAAVLISSGKYYLILVGAILFNIFLILDGADGNIARLNGKNNPYGTWIDNLGGYITYPLIFVSVGIAAESLMPTYQPLSNLNYIFIGSVGAITNLLIRNQYQKFSMVDTNKEKLSSQESSIFFEINQNIGLVGIMTPLLLVFVIFGMLHIFLILYTLYYVCLWVIYTLYQVWRIEYHIDSF